MKPPKRFVHLAGWALLAIGILIMQGALAFGISQWRMDTVEGPAGSRGARGEIGATGARGPQGYPGQDGAVIIGSDVPGYSADSNYSGLINDPEVDLSGIESDIADIQTCQEKLEDYARDLDWYLNYGGLEPWAPTCY